jgi:SAM-dependent methyltransferase
MMKRFFDERHSRLVYVRRKADRAFWEEHWTALARRTVFPRHRTLLRITREYLIEGSSILEGGCGPADKVLRLKENGFETVGLDFAPETLLNARRTRPELDLVAGDVFALPFRDESFDGAWSFGVVEHFHNGFDGILDETRRVLRPFGILFLCFPRFSPLRRLKARLHRYPRLPENSIDPETFYQFALDPRRIRKRLEKRGFTIKHETGFGSLKECKDEIFFAGPAIRLFERTFPRLSAAAGVLLDRLLGGSIGHMQLIVAQKSLLSDDVS